MPRSERLTLGVFVVLILLSGVNAVAIRFSNVELPPFFGGAVRFGFASLVLFAIVAARRLPLPRGRALLGTVFFGVLALGSSFALLYWALLTVHAGLTQVIVSLVPLLTFFFALVHRQESYRGRALAGSLLAIAGVFVIFRDQIAGGAPLPALLAIVLAAACMAEGVVVLKSIPKSHPVTTNAVAMAAAALALSALALLTRETPALPTLAATWAALFYLVLPGTVLVFMMFLFVLQRWSASQTSYQFVLMPFVAVAVSAWLQGEAVTPAFAVGGALVLLGVYTGALARPAPRVEVCQSRPPLDKAA
ncbi:MAG: DMT family transporter [Chloroflexota bacterium]